MLHVKNLTKSFPPFLILNQVSFDLQPSQLLAITGANGSGKTTLLKCILSELTPDEGSVVFDKGIRWGYLPQHMDEPRTSVREYVFSAHPYLWNCLQTLDSTFDPSRTQDAIAYAQALDAYSSAGGYEFQREILRLGGYFGFTEEHLDKPLNQFSEGEKRLWGIVRMLCTHADVFLLDEPTNHLDIAHCVMLEALILNKKEHGQSFVVVSHDRIFIDRVADKTIYLERGHHIQVEGGYTLLLEHLQNEFASKKKLSENLRKKIRQLENDVIQKRQWARKVEKTKANNPHADKGYIGHQSARMAKRATTSARRVTKLVDRLKSEKPFIEKPLNLSFLDYSVPSKFVVRGEGIEKSFQENFVLRGVSIECSTRNRIGMVGENGCGKTTLMRCLVGLERVEKGEIIRNDNIRWLYLPQDIRSFFSHSILLENMMVFGYDETFVRQALGAAKIRGERVFFPIDQLSRGELMRCALVAAILAKTEFLFLDEPTNHLDIESLEVLSDLMDEFAGGVLFISHDRYFIAQHAETLFLLSQGVLREMSFVSNTPSEE